MREANILRDKIFEMLDSVKHEEALCELNTQTISFFENKKNNPYLLAEIAGSYITLGSESFNKEVVTKGMDLFNNNQDLLNGKITNESIYYCIANGYQALYKISTRTNINSFPNPIAVKEYLFDAKNYYLKAYKQIDLPELNDYSIQVLTNLGNNLNHSGRIVEALQLFDIVLHHNPKFPQALISKADGLDYMIGATRCSINLSLIVEIYNLYKTASNQSILLDDIKERVQTGIDKCEKYLQLNNFNFSTLEQELKLNEKEYENHTQEIKYYLNNFLSISEHSLYCKCNGSKIDNLIIGYPEFVTTNKKIAQLEILLNRLKSEFSLARSLFFDFVSFESNDNMYYENIGIHLINGIHFEKLRTSFRICFGILDKIAEGICYLLDLEKGQRENIYFEGFWNSPSAPKDRWDKINSINNIHITALYGIACDLNTHTGEFGFYKTWRNRLEHGVFSLSQDNLLGNNLLEEKMFSEYTTDTNFEVQTKYLLQLTRAAIYSYVYLVRQELITNRA